MKKKYQVEYDFNKGGITVEIDDKPETTEIMHEVNNFWSGSEGRLKEVDGDIAKAFLKMLCPQVLLVDLRFNLGVSAVIRAFQHEEGYPPLDGSYGITLLSIDPFEFDASDLDVKEV